MEELQDQLQHTDFVAEAKRLDATEYTGRDPDNLVTAVLTGDGTVVRILFGNTVSARSAGQVEQAILAAMSDAQRQAKHVFQEYLARFQATATEFTAAVVEYERVELARAAQLVRGAYVNVQ
jgi:DNA-binding protein YbaB